jgi:hypothetical protein
MEILAATLKFPQLDKEKSVAEIQLIDQKYWFYDQYRHTNMMPLMTMGGKVGESGASNFRSKEEFVWTPYASETLKSWFEEHVFPWMGARTRISVLKTQPNQKNHEHIDCSPQAFGSRQHKFRIVLQGKTDSLYFVTKYGNILLFDTEDPFLMDGSWPHGMHNYTAKEKYTIAVGAPWGGKDSYSNMGQKIIYRNPNLLPENLEPYYDQRYFKRDKNI